MQNYPEAKELIVLFPYQFQADESLYSGSGNGTVHTWNMKTRRISSTLVAHPGHSVLWIDFTSSGGELWTHGRDGWVKQWSQSDTGWKETGICSNNSFLSLNCSRRHFQILFHYQRQIRLDK